MFVCCIMCILVFGKCKILQELTKGEQGGAWLWVQVFGL